MKMTKLTENDTPRTDKQAMDSSLNGRMMADRVDADFARELERENAALKKAGNAIRFMQIETELQCSEKLAAWDALANVQDEPQARKNTL